MWERVRAHYDDGQVVEILVTIGAYLQVSKFGDAMSVELEDVFHGRPSVLFAAEPPTSVAVQQHLAHLVQPRGEGH